MPESTIPSEQIEIAGQQITVQFDRQLVGFELGVYDGDFEAQTERFPQIKGIGATREAALDNLRTRIRAAFDSGINS